MWRHFNDIVFDFIWMHVLFPITWIFSPELGKSHKCPIFNEITQTNISKFGRNQTTTILPNIILADMAFGRTLIWLFLSEYIITMLAHWQHSFYYFITWISDCIHCMYSKGFFTVGSDLRQQHASDLSGQALQWRYNHRRHNCFLNRFFRHRSKKTSKLHVTGRCAGEFTGDRWVPLTKGQ